VLPAASSVATALWAFAAQRLALAAILVVGAYDGLQSSRLSHEVQALQADYSALVRAIHE
jgi:hypothetical protein